MSSRRRRHRKSPRKAGGLREVVRVNPGAWSGRSYLLWFSTGGFSNPIYLLAEGSNLESALEEAVDWVVEHAPGILSDDEGEEAYKEALAERLAGLEASSRAGRWGGEPRLEARLERAPSGEGVVPSDTVNWDVDEGDDAEDVEQAAQEEAEEGHTMWGHSGIHYVPSGNWGIVAELPTREFLLEFEGRPPERRARGSDPMEGRRPGHALRKKKYGRYA